jgi:TIR domain
MSIVDKKWDFFIAHAGVDTPIAEQLFDLLAGSAKVFLDSRSLELGDNWDLELAAAQRESLITVVLVTQNTDPAYYQRVEVAQAITMSRALTDQHRVIPLYVDEASTKGISAEYGLNLKHGLFLSSTVTLETAAFRLLATLKRLKYQTVLFDSREGAASHFRGYANSFWTGKGAETKRSSPIGEGQLTIEPGGILRITRTSAEGRFEVQLYEHESLGPKSIRKVFPGSELAVEDRRLWIHCEARTDGAKHGIRFVLKNDATDSWLASEKRVVISKDWITVDVYLRVNPKLDFWFRIDNEEVSSVPSELQLRNIVLRERS